MNRFFPGHCICSKNCWKWRCRTPKSGLYLPVCRGTYEHSTCDRDALIVEPWAGLVGSMEHYCAAACEAEYLRCFMGVWHRICQARTMLVGIPFDRNLQRSSYGRGSYAGSVGACPHFFFFPNSPERRRNWSERNAEARRSIEMAQWAYKVVYID